MARRKKEDALETRERILDAASEIFNERGLARPSLTDVATRAGVTRGAVYGHFENKSDVFHALCDRIKLPQETLPGPGECLHDPLGKLRQHLLSTLRETARDKERQRIFGIIFHRCELLEENGFILKRMQDGRCEGMAAMTRLIEMAVARNQLPADLDTRRALWLTHSTLIGLLHEWLFDPATLDLEADAESLVDAMIDALKLAPSLRRPA
jgi:TetR/AcrR family acrAB operon transcriptional repressor